MNNIKSKTISIHEIEIGMTASFKKLIEFKDVKKFSELSGDTNPIHIDKEYAAKSRYKKNIAHGLLSSSFFSGIFGTKLPEKVLYIHINHFTLNAQFILVMRLRQQSQL